MPGGNSDIANSAFLPSGSRLYVIGYTRLGANFDNDGKIAGLGDQFAGV